MTTTTMDQQFSLSGSPLLRVEFDSERLCPELSFKRVFLGKFAGCQRPLSPIMHHASITISPIKSSCLRFLEKKSVCKFWMLVRVCNIIKHLPLSKQPLYFRETNQGWQKTLQVNWLGVSKNLVRWLGVRSVFFGTTLKPPSSCVRTGEGCK